jgi:hypothetical protein
MDYVVLGVALVVGIGIGYGLAIALADKGADNTPVATGSKNTEWWKVRQSLTGTQLQILQYMEAHKQVSITGLQEKFSFIPDRELYYRLEQIVLMQFLVRERKEGEVYYILNPDYSGTVEDDKTVMLAPE